MAFVCLSIHMSDLGLLLMKRKFKRGSVQGSPMTSESFGVSGEGHRSSVSYAGCLQAADWTVNVVNSCSVIHHADVCNQNQVTDCC